MPERASSHGLIGARTTAIPPRPAAAALPNGRQHASVDKAVSVAASGMIFSECFILLQPALCYQVYRECAQPVAALVVGAGDGIQSSPPVNRRRRAQGRRPSVLFGQAAN